MIRRREQGKPVKWGLSAVVIERLLQQGDDIKVVYSRTGMVRADALGPATWE
jgi:hypothetical protein